MKHDPANVHALLDEYRSLVESYEHPGTREEGFNWADIADSLHTELGWTPSGAEHIAVLARQYGSFVLRNALALALAMGIEDGELGL